MDSKLADNGAFLSKVKSDVSIFKYDSNIQHRPLTVFGYKSNNPFTKIIYYALKQSHFSSLVLIFCEILQP